MGEAMLKSSTEELSELKSEGIFLELPAWQPPLGPAATPVSGLRGLFLWPLARWPLALTSEVVATARTSWRSCTACGPWGLEPQLLLLQPGGPQQSVSREQLEQLSNTSRSKSAAVVLGPGLGSSKLLVLPPAAVGGGGLFLTGGTELCFCEVEGPGVGSKEQELPLGFSSVVCCHKQPCMITFLFLLQFFNINMVQGPIKGHQLLLLVVKNEASLSIMVVM